jgi:DNA (cytosine-5)-methyltransferase 1
LSAPLGTVVCDHGSKGVVTPLFIPQQSCGTAKPTKEPLPTISTAGAISVVEGQVLTTPDGRSYKLDITFRMLQPHELAKAMSFPDDYKFAGRRKSEVIKQIGNAVCPKLSEALIGAALEDVS